MAHPISTQSLAVLRHLKAHGVSTLPQLRAALPGLNAKTLRNLVQYTTASHAEDGYRITANGRAKLAETDSAATQPASGASSTLMLSAAQIQTAIVATLQRTTLRLTLPEIARRACLADHIVRPTLTLMVQSGAVEVKNSKPLCYSLAAPKPAGLRTATYAGLGHSAPLRNSYSYPCPELKRNPGLPDERFASFDLPSRAGNRLHYRDGRVEAVA